MLRLINFRNSGNHQSVAGTHTDRGPAHTTFYKYLFKIILNPSTRKRISYKEKNKDYYMKTNRLYEYRRQHLRRLRGFLHESVKEPIRIRHELFMRTKTTFF